MDALCKCGRFPLTEGFGEAAQALIADLIPRFGDVRPSGTLDPLPGDATGFRGTRAASDPPRMGLGERSR